MKYLNIFPGLPKCNFSNIRFFLIKNSRDMGKCPSFFVQSSYFKNSPKFKFPNWMSIFFKTINYIFGICTNKKVIGIATFWIIAFMANIHSIRNWAFIKLIRITVGANRAFAYIGINHSISGGRSESIPFPAFAIFTNNFFKESFFDWFSFWPVHGDNVI